MPKLGRVIPNLGAFGPVTLCYDYDGILGVDRIAQGCHA